jgi:hypothetical protein
MACSGTDPNLKTLCSAEGGTLACGAGCFRPCPAGQMCPAVMHYCQGDGSCGMNSEPKCEPEIACVQCPIHDAAPHMECTVTRKTTCDQCGAMECTSKCTDDEEYNWYVLFGLKAASMLLSRMLLDPTPAWLEPARLAAISVWTEFTV